MRRREYGHGEVDGMICFGHRRSQLLMMMGKRGFTLDDTKRFLVLEWFNTMAYVFPVSQVSMSSDH